MLGSLHLVERELTRAIGLLDPRQRFNVLGFAAGGARPFFEGSLPATFDNKRRAFEAIRTMDPGGRTEPLDAFRRALQERPDVLCVVSDGGFGAQAAAVLDLVRRENADGRITIHAILVQRDPHGPGGPILQSLARAGGGHYRQVSDAATEVQASSSE